MTILHGDCFQLVKSVPHETFHAIVTDPPYGIEWLNNDWDKPDKLWDKRQTDYPSARGTDGKANLNEYEAGEKFYFWFSPIAREMQRTLKTGGSCFVFSSTRTLHHPMRCLEEAGFLIKDVLMWNYHTGFPKAISVPFLVDKRAGIVSTSDPNGHTAVSQAAQEHEGWVVGRAKPAWEPIIWATKPCDTAIDCMLEDGIGGINVGETRIPVNPEIDDMKRTVIRQPRHPDNVLNFDDAGIGDKKEMFTGVREEGRFPANVVVVNGEILGKPKFNIMYGIRKDDQVIDIPKPDRSERDMGLENCSHNPISGDVWDKKLVCASCGKSVRKPKTTCGCGNPVLQWKKSKRKVVRNTHPTVKPIALFEHLVRLVTRRGQVVADFFEGSGTCAIACKKTGREHWGAEQDEEYYNLATSRVANLFNTYDPWDF